MRLVSFFISLIAVHIATVTAVTPSDVHIVADEVANANAPCESITIVNAALIVIGAGPYPPIIYTISSAVHKLKPTFGPPFTPAENADAVQAFTHLANESTRLSNCLSRKANLITMVPGIGSPVAMALNTYVHSVGATYETFYQRMDDPSRAATDESLRSFEAAVNEAIDKYTSLLG